MKALTGIALILVILLVSLSAYLRLAHSGIGCGDWPQCYGRIGHPPQAEREAGQEAGQAAPGNPIAADQDTYQKLLQQSSQAMAWATPLHRLVASVLGLMVLFLNILAVKQKRLRLISLTLLVLTVGLAVLGIRSGSLHDLAVVMGNLAGGFIMLGLLGWLWFGQTATKPKQVRPSMRAGLVLFAIVLLCGQIVLGGLTSANFAATACRTLPDCHGDWWPGPELATALDLSRKHKVTPSGQAIGGPERIAIHQAHRLGAVLAGAVILLTGILALLSGGNRRVAGAVIVLLVLVEFSVGVASVFSGLPIGLAVAHNWLAALLLLSLLNLLVLQQRNSMKVSD